MKKSTRGARQHVVIMLALAVLIYGLTLPGYSLSGAARQQAASAGRQAARLNSQPGPQADRLSAPLRSALRYGQDKNAEEIHTPEPQGKIAFASDRDGNFEIYVIDPNGGGLTRVTEDAADDVQPTWSGDGQRIAFVSNRDGNREIYVVDADGGVPTRLTNNPATDLNPSWSLDGTKIAFQSNRDGNDEIYVMNSDGSNVTRLTNNPADDVDPTWAPSGTLLAFASNRDGDKFEIYRMSSTGTNLLRLTNNSFNDVSPSWPPARITFQTDRDLNDEIYTMNIDGTNLLRLTNNTDNSGTPGIDESSDLDPARSLSDGSKAVFVSARDGNLELYSVNADGSSPVRLTNNSASDIDPAIQPQFAEGTVQFSAANYTVSEGAGAAAITVTRTGSTSGEARVDFLTVAGSASDRFDFTLILRTLTFAAGETSKTVNVPIINDAYIEGDETFSVTLSDATVAALGGTNTAVVTITDNDTATAVSNPIDDPAFFIRQHYLDFLGREPDPAGFNAWVTLLQQCPASEINNPNSPLPCDRTEVSSAFFRSPEFQLKGYYVLRFYLATLGRLPTYREYVVDAQAVTGQTDQELAERRAAFPAAWVARQEFREHYEALTNEQFVAELARVSGVTPSNQSQLVADLNAGRKTRAQVVLEFVENTQVYNRFYNRAFVAMIYFGYLRRDPDPAGYQAWLEILDRTGDYTHIVWGAVYSPEYKLRFGPVPGF